jgi:hypothetical protein
MIYLRRAGRRHSSELAPAFKHEGLLSPIVWTVRDAGTVIGYVSHGTVILPTRERTRHFRGYGTDARPVTPRGKDRTKVRNATASRKDWT